MGPRFLWTLVILGACQGWLPADEFTAVIVKVEPGKVIFHKAAKKKAEKVPPQTLPAAEHCRVFLAQYNKVTKKIDAGDEVAAGLKNALFEKIPDAGIDARIITDTEGKTITEIRIFQMLKKKGK